MVSWHAQCVIEDTTQMGNHIVAVVDTAIEVHQAKVGVDK